MTMNNYERERERTDRHDREVTININNEDVLRAIRRLAAFEAARHRTLIAEVEALQSKVDRIIDIVVDGGITAREARTLIKQAREINRKYRREV